MSYLRRIKDGLTSFQIIIAGFAGVILIGAFILMLPVSSAFGETTSFWDALFTSASAVCVTGLVVRDTATYWSFFGQAVILLLIQIGGLGVITVVVFLSIITKGKISLKERETIQNALSLPQFGGIIHLTGFIFVFCFLTEGMGAILLAPVFVSEYKIVGIWMALFHSVSAFCNAGFDLMGDKTGNFSSLTAYAGSIYVTAVISLLIITGGLGFITWRDVCDHGIRFKEYKMQTKVILVSTLILILIPTILFYFMDFGGELLKDRICMSVFQAVTPRTAGFNTADLSKMTDAGKTLTMILMLIGGSPGSTAGGMKTTTAAVLFANIIAVFKRKRSAEYFGRRVGDDVVKNASAIMLMYVMLAMGSAIAISQLDKLPIQSCMFEAISAIGTVGLSLGITSDLSQISRVILIMLMFFGRVGGLTLIYAALSHSSSSMSKYPVGSIMVG